MPHEPGQERNEIEVACPCCRRVLTIDVGRQCVVAHSEPVSRATSFDIAGEVDKLRQKEQQRDQEFAGAVSSYEINKAKLGDRFDKLLAKTKEQGPAGPTIRDIDLD